MPIPERFKRRPSAEELKEFLALCDEIEDGVSSGANVGDKLERWNQRSGRKYAAVEFKTYYGAVSKETFVTRALLGRAEWVDDLTYGELEAVMEALCQTGLPEADNDFFMEWVEANLPGARIVELIFYPEEWFGYVSPRFNELTPRQLLAYARHRAGRVFEDAPEVELPIPLPGTEAGEAARHAAQREAAWSVARAWAEARAASRWVEATSKKEHLGALLITLPADDVPELRELHRLRGAACLERMRELGLVVEAAPPEPAPPPAPISEPPPIERVHHKKFGVGVVKAREGVGDDAKLEIEFDIGVKRLIARFVTAVEEG